MEKLIWRKAFGMVEHVLPRIAAATTADEMSAVFEDALPVYVDIAQQGETELGFAMAIWDFLSGIARGRMNEWRT